MKISNQLLLIICLLLLTGCNKKENIDTRFRVSSFLYSPGDVSIEISKKGSVKFSSSIDYLETLPYNKLSPGLYTIKFSLGNKVLINKEVGFGWGDSYTFVLFGLPVTEQKLNQTNLNTRLQNIAGGVEAVTPNNYLPQFKILNDAFQGNDKEAKLRWVHLVPGANAISAKIIDKKNDTVDFEQLPYPHSSQLITAQTGATKIFWYLGSEKRIVADTSIVIKPNSLYTFILGPKEEKFLDSLELITVITRQEQ